MVSTLISVVSSIMCLPGTAIYKVLAEHKKGHLLSFQKTNAEEEIFSVAKLTGIVTSAGKLVERTTHKVHVLVAGAGSKHVSMVTLFVNVVPPLTTIKQPPSLVVAVNPDEIPKVVKTGTKPQKDHLWKIVYGNKEKVLLGCLSPISFPSQVLSIKEKTGEVILRHIHCSGRHDIFVGIYAKDKKPAMTLQKITLNMTGKA